jgi:predicted amidophosphoribosyltransferase
MKIPNLVNSLKRVRRTSTQTRKNRSQRLDNMYQAFQVSDPQVIRSKHILLVDDVLTSGATLESCGYAILGIADTRVSMATLAIGH